MQYLFIPSVILALLDYVQVILFAIGMVFLIKYTRQHSNKTTLNILIIGASIATLAGILKATWKLVYAITGNSVSFLNDYHMYGLALGTAFIFIATFALAKKDKAEVKQNSTMHAFPIFHLTVGVLFIATYGYLINLIRLSARNGYKKAVIAFVIYMVIALSNAGLSGNREHEIIHWIAEIVGIISNAALIIGTREIYKRSKKA